MKTTPRHQETLADPAPATLRAVGRAIDELKRGDPVQIGAHLFLAVETADVTRLAAFDANGRADLLVTPERANALRLANQRPVAGAPAVFIQREARIDLCHARTMADPTLDLAAPLKGPYRGLAVDPETRHVGQAALRLARIAGLLPALFVRPADQSDPDRLQIARDAIENYRPRHGLYIAARAPLPTLQDAKAHIVAFRAPASGDEHLAILFGENDPQQPPLVRLHSACLTGDLLGSLKCDCGAQLHAAIAAITQEKSGILLYLRQEGRGIGLINKIRAYDLQNQGLDTMRANLHLGFAMDERDFALAARMLHLLGVQTVRLLTNNPDKVAGLQAAGVEIAARLPLRGGENAHNDAYLARKKQAGHWL